MPERRHTERRGKVKKKAQAVTIERTLKLNVRNKINPLSRNVVLLVEPGLAAQGCNETDLEREDGHQETGDVRKRKWHGLEWTWPELTSRS